MTEREKIVQALRVCSEIEAHSDRCKYCPWNDRCDDMEHGKDLPMPLIRAALDLLQRDGITMEGIQTVISGRANRFAGEGFQVIPE